MPVLPGSAIETALVAHFTATFALNSLLTRSDGAESEPLRQLARRAVARAWGPCPDLETRFEFRRLLHAQLLGLFFVLGLGAVATMVVGSATGAQWLELAGRGLLAVACVPLGMHGPVAVRTALTDWDFHRWTSAGRPEHWDLRPSSQPRSTDLVWGSLLALFWVWFFVTLSLG